MLFPKHFQNCSTTSKFCSILFSHKFLLNKFAFNSNYSKNAFLQRSLSNTKTGILKNEVINSISPTPSIGHKAKDVKIPFILSEVIFPGETVTITVLEPKYQVILNNIWSSPKPKGNVQIIFINFIIYSCFCSDSKTRG
jgi:hypothetical protein